MNVFIVSAHETQRSLTSALHNTSLGVLQRSGHQIAVSELYSQQFNPVATHMDFVTNSVTDANYMFEQQRAVATGLGFSPDITTEIDKLQKAELLILHFPLWWGGPPAIMKGWLDRVLAMGVAWGPDNRYSEGFFRGKKVLLCISTGDPDSYYTKEGMHGATVEQHLYPLIHSTLAFCGFDVLSPFIITNTTAAPKKEIDAAITKYQQLLGSIADAKDFAYKYS